MGSQVCSAGVVWEDKISFSEAEAGSLLLQKEGCVLWEAAGTVRDV